MSAGSSAQNKKDFDKFTKFFIYKCVQIIVQSRLGEKIKSRSKHVSSGSDWFNIAIADNNEVEKEAKKVLSNQTSTLGQTVCIEISLQTCEGDTMVLEIWHISLDINQCDVGAKVSQAGYYRMGIALKSLLSVTRVTPAYKLSRRQASNDYVICYRIYLGEPHYMFLGEDTNKSKVGSVPTPFGTISINLCYRTKLLISPQNTQKEIPFEMKHDHFKQDHSPIRNHVRPTTPKPCAFGHKRESILDSDSSGLHSEEYCKTTFSTSPCESPRIIGADNVVPHHQSQPIKIHLPGSSPVGDRFPDFKTQSAPEKPSGFPATHRVGAFAKNAIDKQSESSEDVPFMSLLQQVKKERVDKVDPKNLSGSKGTSSSKTESSKADTVDSVLSESKTSTSSQHSATDDFVMVELKTPFGVSDSNTDLGKFYQECQNAPPLCTSEEEQTLPETLEKITSQLSEFETQMKDFDDFVAELTVDAGADTSVDSVAKK
ncbi:autophagy-related protein 13-like isoform X2 [Dreissena polymorpha]|uniref:autophagy-related protein 13-like isoform X2 n=1 Tax=Dreissena polymorpha TaxID=45954 RepID=UPI002264A917|nr:autophagy-related protein 13-like isoform X2 [Dreissena polymorpha]